LLGSFLNLNTKRFSHETNPFVVVTCIIEVI
jgi:hypothetical protein